MGSYYQDSSEFLSFGSFSQDQKCRMSYYRFITGVYKSYWPQLNRTLRSSSVPRHVSSMEETVSRRTRASSVPAGGYYSSSYFMRNSATPFRDRAMSVQPSSQSYQTNLWNISSSSAEPSHYSDFDCKVIDYMSKLERQDMVKTYVSRARTSNSARVEKYEQERTSRYESPSFQSQYNYYDGIKHERDYLYPVTRDVMGSWKHFNLSRNTLDARNRRATSPLESRELDRYFGTQKRNDFVGSMSSGCATDFRYYNYRRVPYLGGSDHYKYLNKMVIDAIH